MNVLMPQLGETVTEGKIAIWFKAVGDRVAPGENLFELETDKTSMEVPATEAGVLTEIRVKEGEIAPVNAIVAVIGGAAAHVAPERLRVSPLARRLAAEAGIDLARVKGSGPHGRIHARDIPSPAVQAPAVQAPAAPAPEIPRSAHETVPLDAMRRTIAKRLVEAKQTVPHFYLVIDVDLDRLLALREGANLVLPVKLSINDFIVKALALALQRVPAANAVWAGDSILRFRHSDIGVAVAVEGGLFTPVIRKAESKPLSEISAEMKDLAARARERKLLPHEYQGGAASISNLGMYGVREFSAIINPPQATMLAVGAAQRRPVEAAGGGVRFATQMTVTLSCDHRVVDGATGAQLLAAFRSLMEEPGPLFG